MINIVIIGSKGRMGRRVVALAEQSQDLNVIAQIDKGDSLEVALRNADVAVDFTIAQATAENATIAAKLKKPIIVGTTGLNDAQGRLIREAATIVPVVWSANMSIGVNLMWKLLEIAAKTLSKEFKVDIVETHHAHKVDKPSGTAKEILDIIVKGSGRSLERDVFFSEDETASTEENGDADVSVRSIRRGEVVGDHAVHFTSPGETISITHHAATRDIFAQGALLAARWIIGKKAGLYSMKDVLGL